MAVSRGTSIHADGLVLYGRIWQHLRIVANDGLPLLPFHEEIESLRRGTDPRVGRDDIYRTDQRIVARKDTILIGLPADGILVTLAADPQDFHV